MGVVWALQVTVFLVLLPSRGHLCLAPQAVAIFRLAFPLSYNIWFCVWVREAFRGSHCFL